MMQWPIFNIFQVFTGVIAIQIVNIILT